MVVSGAQQALHIAARVLLGRRPVWVEEPGYPGRATCWTLAGARLMPVRRQGARRRAGIARHGRPAVYVTPSSYPLGVTMALEAAAAPRAGDAWRA
jgi:DNA-binding transcriptional MocR family regulator